MTVGCGLVQLLRGERAFLEYLFFQVGQAFVIGPDQSLEVALAGALVVVTLAGSA